MTPSLAPMRLLLSAYSCEPGRGSEQAVGWNWALALATRGHEVWVITRENNRPAIEAALALQPGMSGLHFVYHDLPPRLRRWKRGGRGVHLYYLLWQWTALKRARLLHKEVGFDRVHHVTFVSLRLPSFMGALGIPFTFGPVAGAEAGPWNLWKQLPWRERLKEGVRSLANVLLRFDPLVRLPLRRADRIWVTSAQTLQVVPAAWRGKASISLAIGLAQDEIMEAVAKPRLQVDGPGLRCLYVGRFVGLKGMHLGLEAFAQLRRRDPQATLTMVGEGPCEGAWRQQVQQLSMAEAVSWTEWLPRNRVQQLYLEHDVLLFPSLHDTGGMVVLEAMCHGMVPVCLALGGPSVIVSADCGYAVETSGCSAAEVVARLAEALGELTSPATRQRLSEGARRRVRVFTYDALVDRVYALR